MKLPTLFFIHQLRQPDTGCRGGIAHENARRLLGTLVLAGLTLESAHGFAAAPPGSAPLPAASAALASAGLKPVSKAGASWAELTPEQQQALAPLAADWNDIHESQKRKWLEVSKNYRAMTPAEKTKLNSRMREWVALSPQQRAQARLNFGKTKELSRQLTPEERKEKWNAYQALSPEEKEKLAARASPKPSGAATAIKPVPPQKLATVPADGNKPAKPPLKSAPKIMALPSAGPASAAGPAPAGAASAPPQR